MAARRTAIIEGDVALEVDLPEIVRVRVLETVISRRLRLFVVIANTTIVAPEEMCIRDRARVAQLMIR